MLAYILKDRRHEGPFGFAELRGLLDAGKVQLGDYVISSQDLESGHLRYKSLAEHLGVERRHGGRGSSIPSENFVDKRKLSPRPKLSIDPEKIKKAMSESVNWVELLDKHFRMESQSSGQSQVDQWQAESQNKPQTFDTQTQPLSAWLSALQDKLPSRKTAALLGLLLVLGMVAKAYWPFSVAEDKQSVKAQKPELSREQQPSAKKVAAPRPPPSSARTLRVPSTVERPASPEAALPPQDYMPPAPAVEEAPARGRGRPRRPGNADDGRSLRERVDPRLWHGVEDEDFDPNLDPEFANYPFDFGAEEPALNYPYDYPDGADGIYRDPAIQGEIYEEIEEGYYGDDAYDWDYGQGY